MSQFRKTTLGPQIVLSPEEKRVYGQLFKLADIEKKGVIEGRHAVKFFSTSGLSPSILSEIWQIADSENLGYLSQQSFSIAIKLIAQVQNGQSPDPVNINAAAPLPRFDGVYIISSEDREKYMRMFIGLNPINGDLDAERAGNFFTKSKLSFDKLRQIWSLADTRKRGKLDSTEFIIAMYFVQNTMNGTIKNIPSVLPDGFFDMASGMTASASTFPTSSQPIPKQIPGVVDAPMSPVIQDNYSWDVTAEDKETYDRFFNSLDGISNKGYLTGEEAASFFMKSQLSPNLLAQIWDLAAIRKTDSLNRDEFAVAMYLITKKMSGAILPTTLPPSLIPPSMRSIHAAFPDSIKRSGTLRNSPSIGKRSSLFVFEQGLNVSSPTPFFNSVPVSQSSSDFDLLGDTDINTQVAIENGEIRALKSQAENLSDAVSEFKISRANIGTDLANLAIQKNEVTTRLSQIRTLHDSEHRSLQEVQANYKIEYESLEREREELAQAERALENLQLERDQLQASIQKDRDEMLDIKKRMRLAEEKNVSIKAEIEKLKMEGKKQKGLLDINRMQLASAEKEKDKTLKTLLNLEGRDVPDNDPFGTGAFTPPPVNQSDSILSQSNMNLPSGLEFVDNSSQSKSITHNQHSSISSLAGVGVKRTMSNSSLASSGKTDHNTTFSATFNSSNDTVTSESFKTEFPSLEEIEASVESSAKIGFDNDFSSIYNSTENMNTAILNPDDSKGNYNEAENVSDNPAPSESEPALPENPVIVKELPMEETKDKTKLYNKGVETPFFPISGEVSESLGGGLAPLQDSEPWISVEKTSESKPAVQMDEFDVFADLTEAKVTKTAPINFDEDFDDTDFKEDFNPTFDAPITHSKSAFNASNVGNNMGVTSSVSSLKSSSADFDEVFGSSFVPFSSSTTPNATKPNLDAAFGGMSGEPQKSTDPSFGFEDAFGDFLKTPSAPSSKTEPPLDLKLATTIDSKTSIPLESSPQPKIQTVDDDDDSELVKQMKAMGFTREKSIDALERYDYDIEKASNFLLGN